MDYIPYEQFDWSPSRERVSLVYASIFTDYKLGFRRPTADERARYETALTRLYQSPDRALLLRGELPELRPSSRALDYFIRSLKSRSSTYWKGIWRVPDWMVWSTP